MDSVGWPNHPRKVNAVGTSSSKTNLNLDTKVLSGFIYALNIARRQSLVYPAGHPLIDVAVGKLLGLLPKMFEFRSAITIGIASDTLLVDGQVLDSKNPIYRDVATNLFEAKIASLTIQKDVTAAEICKFFEILRYDPEGLTERGGLDRVLVLEDIRGLSAQYVTFDAFHATEVEKAHAPKSKLIEDETTVLWKSFVNALVAGTLDPEGEKLVPDVPLDPELLAEILSREEDVEGNKHVRNYEEAITSFLKETDRDQLQSQANQEILGRLGDLVSSLKPELRRRFLNSTLRSCADQQEVTTGILGHLPQAQILEAMEQVDTDQLEVPQALMDVLGKLSQQDGSATGGSRVAGKSERSTDETAKQLGQLFSADQAGRFIPEDYQDALAILTTAESLPGLDHKQVRDLVDTLEGHIVEKHFCDVMIDLLDRGTDAVTTTAISRNMEELILYFLKTGDFPSLISVHDHLSNHVLKIDDWRESPSGAALRVYETEEFVEHVLDGLDTWGKSAHGAIKSLIGRVGLPFVAPLLKRLAEEPSMSKRRLCMECLQVVGTAAREQIVSLLHDKRWFFVRNLVILLRRMDDPTVLQPLEHLAYYAHPKVQFEVIRTFLHFKDPRADRYLLKKLDSNDQEVLLTIARLAASSRSPEVARKLSEVLNRKLPKEFDEKIKSDVINSLAEMARPEALPALARFLLSRDLLQSITGNCLKVKAAKSLERYSDQTAATLSKEVHQKYSGDLARTAGQVCLQFNEKMS